MALHIRRVAVAGKLIQGTGAALLSRRGLLRWSAAAVATGMVGSLPGCTCVPSYPSFRGQGGPPPDEPERWALLSDLHLAGDPGLTWGSVNMAAQARAAVTEILGAVVGPGSGGVGGSRPPSGVIVNGDCALEFGGVDDYRSFHDLVVAPLANAGLPLHVTLGNHDHRDRFRHCLADCLARSRAVAVPAADPAESRRGAAPVYAAASAKAAAADPEAPPLPAVEYRFASVVRGRWANFFLLDSLDNRHHLAGSIGRRQLAWLDASLSWLNDRPAIVVAHHPIDPERNWLWGNTSLLDGEDLWRVLDRHAHVKAFLYGHTHRWEITRRGHVHLINLPSTAYVFDPGQPSAWVDLWLGRDGALLNLRRITPAGPPRPGESSRVEWV